VCVCVCVCVYVCVCVRVCVCVCVCVCVYVCVFVCEFCMSDMRMLHKSYHTWARVTFHKTTKFAHFSALREEAHRSRHIKQQNSQIFLTYGTWQMVHVT